MARTHHELKTQTEYFQAVERGDKFFEVRKNDRNYQTYDMITLVEVVGPDEIKTGRHLGSFEITYVLSGGKFGIDPAYCVIGFKK